MDKSLEVCRNCESCHGLWCWDNSPEGKHSGYCCTLFMDTGEDIVVQLHSVDIPNRDLCECFTNKWEE